MKGNLEARGPTSPQHAVPHITLTCLTCARWSFASAALVIQLPLEKQRLLLSGRCSFFWIMEYSKTLVFTLISFQMWSGSEFFSPGIGFPNSVSSCMWATLPDNFCPAYFLSKLGWLKSICVTVFCWHHFTNKSLNTDYSK